jgi:hypothetical protein
MKQTNVEAVAALAALGQAVLNAVSESKLLRKKPGRKKGKRRGRPRKAKANGVAVVGRRAKRPLAPVDGTDNAA